MRILVVEEEVKLASLLSRYELLEAAWGGDYENRSNVVDQQVRVLRQRIDRPFGRDTIETVRGVGYLLRPDPSP